MALTAPGDLRDQPQASSGCLLYFQGPALYLEEWVLNKRSVNEGRDARDTEMNKR